MHDNLIVFKGIIKLISPLLLGSGISDNTDQDLLRDGEGKPFIPATSFAGVTRHFIRKTNIKLDKYFGDGENNKSRIVFSDLKLLEISETKIRDGIRIDNKKGLVKEGGKFDYELIERNSTFSLKIELPYKSSEKDDVYLLLKLIKTALDNGYISVGAKTNNGFGLLKLEEHNISDYNLKRQYDLAKYLKDELINNINLENISFNFNEAYFELSLKLLDAFIIRDYSEYADAESIKSLGKPLITASSLKGALRARAEKILNTIMLPQQIAEQIFGYVKEEEEKAKRGKIKIYETLIKDYSEEIQSRIKINRFTGAPIKTALFDTMPLFFKKQNGVVNIKLKLAEPTDAEIGLILLVLKDLFTGDIAVGGEKSVGRGRMEGLSMKIKIHEKIYEYKKDSPPDENTKNVLNNYITKLLKEREN